MGGLTMHRMSRRAVLTVAFGVAGAGVGAGPRVEPVAGWLARHAVPLTTVDPAAELDDLAPRRRRVLPDRPARVRLGARVMAHIRPVRCSARCSTGGASTGTHARRGEDRRGV